MIAMKVEIRDSKLHLSGYVNAVERDSKVITTKRGKCVEQIAAGAFAASMADGHEVRMKLNHKRDIGSTADGVLTLKEDNIGLYAEAETDDEELMTLAGKGELRGWSFGFVAKDDELESRDGKEPRRRVKALDLQEVSILSVTPAYNGTSVEVRSYEQYSDTVEAYRDDKGNIIDVTVSHRESDNDGSRETTTYTDGRGTITETVTRTHTYKEDAQALKNTIAQLRMKGYILEKRAEQRELEERYNHYHDPRNGRFASGKGGGNGLYHSTGKGQGVYTTKTGKTIEVNNSKQLREINQLQELADEGRMPAYIPGTKYEKDAVRILKEINAIYPEMDESEANRFDVDDNRGPYTRLGSKRVRTKYRDGIINGSKSGIAVMESTIADADAFAGLKKFMAYKDDQYDYGKQHSLL